MAFPKGFFAPPTNSATVTTAVSVYLNALSNAYQSIATTTLGQSVFEEDATKLPILGTVSPITRCIKNNGGYPIGYRDYTGTLICAIAPGGVLFAQLQNNSTNAGVWSITGTNLDPGLITLDNTFSSTFKDGFAQRAILDANTSIHFVKLSTGFSAVVVDNLGKVVTTPVTVSSTSNDVPLAVFTIDTTHAIVFYGASATSHHAVVLSISGASPSLTLTVNTPQAFTATMASSWDGENSYQAPKIAQLASGLFLASYVVAATSCSVVAISVSGVTTTIGSGANIITSNVVASSTETYAIDAATGLVLYKSGASAPYTNSAVIVSVSGSTCTVNTPASLTGVVSSTTTAAASALLSTTKCLVADDNNVAGSVIASVFTISGVTVTAGTAVSAVTGISNGVTYTSNSATRFNPHIFPLGANSAHLWYLDNGSVSQSLVLSESAGTVTAGATFFASISAAASNSAGFGVILPQSTTEYLSIKEALSSTAGYANLLSPCKISGSTITYGTAKRLTTFAPLEPPAGAGTVYASRNGNGDYVIYSNAWAPSLSVYRSNGDAINYRGDISMPIIALPANPNFNQGLVANNRTVFLGLTTVNGSTVSASLGNVRLIQVEFAA